MIARLAFALAAAAAALLSCAPVEGPGKGEEFLIAPDVVVANSVIGGVVNNEGAGAGGGFKTASTTKSPPGWTPVRRTFFGPAAAPPAAAYHVILIAGPALAGAARMRSAGVALCGKAGFSEGEGLDPENLALVSAPIARTIDAGQKANLAEDYDFTRAARWLDTISGAAPGRGARLDRGAFGFIAAPADPTPGLDGARPGALDEADAIYIDLSAISAGYVEEVVDRIVAGMRERNAVSHTGAIGVLEVFSLVERIGAATLQLTEIFGVGPVQAAPADGGC